MTRRARRLLLVAGAALAAYFLFWPTDIDPVAWQPPPDPGRSGTYAANHLLSGIRILPEAGPGPEAVAATSDGWLYAGLQDGRVVRMRVDGSGLETFARTGGRPLGMKFDAHGNLIVADAFRGLLSIAPGGQLTVLADNVEGERMRFVNDLAIGADGVIWFSDSSRRFDQHHWMLDFWEARPTGRLLRYDPSARRVSVVLDRLMFSNGVALGPGDEFVLVSETLAARITRHWLHGPKAGQTDSFAPALPGYPDNLTYDGRGIFWVAIPSPRVPALERMAGVPWLRRFLFHIPAPVRDPKPGRMAWVLGLDTEGRVVRNLQDPSGAYGPVTSALAFGGRLYFGSIETTAIGWVTAPAQ
jgi:sugar lactone lactonase YvrE